MTFSHLKTHISYERIQYYEIIQISTLSFFSWCSVGIYYPWIPGLFTVSYNCYVDTINLSDPFKCKKRCYPEHTPLLGITYCDQVRRIWELVRVLHKERSQWPWIRCDKQICRKQARYKRENNGQECEQESQEKNKEETSVASKRMIPVTLLVFAYQNRDVQFERNVLCDFVLVSF